MSNARLEHLNVTVRDPKRTAKVLCDLFDWKIRWEGDAIYNGYTIHVGEQDTYLALYSMGDTTAETNNSYRTVNALNHIGIVVDDLTTTEARIIEAGFTTHSHADYTPGKRFYFQHDDELEIEVVEYCKP